VVSCETRLTTASSPRRPTSFGRPDSFYPIHFTSAASGKSPSLPHLRLANPTQLPNGSHHSSNARANGLRPVGPGSFYPSSRCKPHVGRPSPSHIGTGFGNNTHRSTLRGCRADESRREERPCGEEQCCDGLAGSATTGTES